MGSFDSREVTEGKRTCVVYALTNNLCSLRAVILRIIEHVLAQGRLHYARR